MRAPRGDEAGAYGTQAAHRCLDEEEIEPELDDAVLGRRPGDAEEERQERQGEDAEDEHRTRHEDGSRGGEDAGPAAARGVEADVPAGEQGEGAADPDEGERHL